MPEILAFERCVLSRVLPALDHEFLDITKTEAEPEELSDVVTDETGRKAVTLQRNQLHET